MSADGQNGANGDYADGVEALQRGDLNRAQADFDKVLAGNPTHAGALNGSGLIAARRGDRSTAVRRFKTAMGVAPDFVAPIQNLAHLIRETHPREAVVLYQKAAKKDPKNPEFLIALTAILERLGDDTAAEGVAREGLKAFRDHPALLAVAATCRCRAGEREEALLQIDRGEPDTGWDPRIRQMWHYRRARILDSLDRLDEALAEAERGHAALELLNPKAFAERAQYASDVRALGTFFADRADLRPTGDAGHDRCFILGLPGSGIERLVHLMNENETVSARRDVPAIMQVMRGIYGNPVIPRVAEEGLLADARRHYEGQMRQDDAIKVDGYDLNICFAGLIDQLFPKAQFVLVTRHPAQACLQLKLSGAEPNPGSANFISIEHASKLIHAISDCWLKLSGYLGDRLVTVRYEDLANDCDQALMPVANSLGLSRLAGTFLTHEDVGDWRRYRDYLPQGMFKNLKPLADAWGYDL